MGKCAVVGCKRQHGLRTILVPVGDIQLAPDVCLPCEVQIDERLEGPKDLYMGPSQEGAVTEKATKNVKPGRVEDKNVKEDGFDATDSEE